MSMQIISVNAFPEIDFSTHTHGTNLSTEKMNVKLMSVDSYELAVELAKTLKPGTIISVQSYNGYHIVNQDNTLQRAESLSVNDVKNGNAALTGGGKRSTKRIVKKHRIKKTRSKKSQKKRSRANRKGRKTRRH